MLPKRKLIKKQYLAPDPNTVDASQPSNCQNLLQLLHSTQPKQISDAISAIANLQQIPAQIQQQLYSTSTIVELVKMVKIGQSSSIVQTTLFAINNLCVNAGDRMGKIVSSLFQVGFAEALVAVNSNDVNLIKPILVLMANIGQLIPHKYQYLLTGIQQTICTNHNKYLCSPHYPLPLILQFLLRSNYTLPLPYTTPQLLTPQHLNMIKQLQIISQSDKSYKNRAMATVILINMTQGKAKQCVELFMSNFQEFIGDVDLEKEYLANFVTNNHNNNNNDNEQDIDQYLDQQQDEQEQQQQDHQMHQQQKNKQKHPPKQTKHSQKKPKNKNSNKQLKQQNIQQTKQKNNNTLQIQSDSPYNLFIDAVEGQQILLEFVVELFQDQANFNDEDDDQQQQQEGQDDGDQGEAMDGQGKNQGGNSKQFDKNMFVTMFGQTIVKNISQFQKYTSFSFVQGQNIIQLILRMMLSLPQSLISPNLSNPNPTNISQIPTSTIITLTQQIIISQFKHYLSPSSYSNSAFTSHQIPQQIFIFNLQTALQLILQCKNIINRTIYCQLPYLKYGQNQNNNNKNNGEVIMKINAKWKQCWMYLLQIYSIFFNPQKNINTTQHQNTNIGGTLKKLIIQIPQLQLQQWRGQAIDTLFDIYSNQKYDKIFMSLGFIQILNQILKVSHAANQNKIGNYYNNNNKKNKKNNSNSSSSKFITAVLSDIQRFIGYKKKMIGF